MIRKSFYHHHFSDVKMLRLITSQIFFLIFLSYSNAWHEKNLVTRGLSTRLHMLDPPVKDSQKVADEWFEQRLDHFDSQNTERWMQRYFSRYIGMAITAKIRINGTVTT